MNELSVLLDALRIEPEWVLREGDGVGFVAGELGTWLSVHAGRVTAQLRVATGVPVTSHSWQVVNARNERATIGRWVLAGDVVSLVATLPAGCPLAFQVAAICELVSVAEEAAFVNWPRREFGAENAVTLIGGRRRRRMHRMVDFRDDVVFPAAESPQTAQETVIWAADGMLYHVLGWSLEHHEGESWAETTSPSNGRPLRLLLAARKHPTLGWGVMVSLGGAAFAAEETAVLAAVTTANRRQAAGDGGSRLGVWLHNGVAVEYRAFVPNGLLQTLAFPDTAALVGSLIDEAFARQAGPDAAGNETGNAAGNEAESLRTRWPDDDQAAALARCDPPNDVLENVPADRSIFRDRFGRGCALTDDSFRAWRRQLTEADTADPMVAAFSRFVERCIADRAARCRTPSTAAVDLGAASQAGNQPPTLVSDTPKTDRT